MIVVGVKLCNFLYNFFNSVRQKINEQRPIMTADGSGTDGQESEELKRHYYRNTSPGTFGNMMSKAIHEYAEALEASAGGRKKLAKKI